MSDQSTIEQGGPSGVEDSKARNRILSPDRQSQVAKIFGTETIESAYEVAQGQVGEEVIKISKDGNFNIPRFNAGTNFLLDQNWFKDLSPEHQREALLNTYKFTTIKPTAEKYDEFLDNLEITAREDGARRRLEEWRSRQEKGRISHLAGKIAGVLRRKK